MSLRVPTSVSRSAGWWWRGHSCFIVAWPRLQRSPGAARCWRRALLTVSGHGKSLQQCLDWHPILGRPGLEALLTEPIFHRPRCRAQRLIAPTLPRSLVVGSTCAFGLAVALLALIWSGQAFAFSTPSLAVYIRHQMSWAGSIVTRLIITVFENTSLLERVENTIEDRETAYFSVALNSSLDLRRVFQHVCKIGAVIMRADQAVLWLVDRRSQELEIVELVGRPS